MSAQFLVCPPAAPAFPHPDARRQWERFTEMLQCSCGATLVAIEPHDEAPGSVFIGNGALIVGKLAIVSTFRQAGMRRVQGICRRALTRAGLATTFLRQAYFEGAADTVFDRVRPVCYAGYGPRTERSATLQLSEVVGCRILSLMLVDERFVHLDTALCPLASGHVLVYMPAFSQQAQTLLRRTIDPAQIIEIGIDDALALACNAVEVGDALVFHRVSRGLRSTLNGIGYRVFCTDLGEFIDAGGSAKSLALRLDDGPVAAAVA